VTKVYIVRLSRPIGSEKHRAQYYIGLSKDPEARLNEHKAGRGSRFLAAAHQQGVDMEIIHTFPGTRTDEKRLKAQKGVERWLIRNGIVEVDSAVTGD
jgi:predicted GIY-YIG superfamily endonuclease